MDFRQSSKNKRKDIFVSSALLITLFFALNFLFSKIDGFVDLSKKEKHSLSLDSKIRLNEIKCPVDIFITIQERSKNPKIIQKLLHDLGIVLDSFESYKSKFPIRIHRINIDSIKDAKVVKRFNLVKRNAIIITTEQNRKKILFSYNDSDDENILSVNSNYRSNNSLIREKVWESGFYSNWKESINGIFEPTQFNGESLILNSILEIAASKNEKNTVYFTQGHGEGNPYNSNINDGFSELKDIFERINFKVSTINLAEIENVPSNCKILVIIGPDGLFYEKEIAVIRNFVKNEKGSVLISIDPDEKIYLVDKPAYGLRNILKEWGIRCHDLLIHDPVKNNYDFFSGDYWLKTYQKNQKNSIVKDLSEGRYYIKSSRLRPVEAISNSSTKFNVDEIIFSSKSSWALSSWVDRSFPPNINELLDVEGPIPVVAISEETSNSSNSNNRRGRIAVFGSSGLVNNKRLKESTGNKILAKNIINWLAKYDQLIATSGKEVKIYNLEMNEKDFHKFLYGISIIPISVILLGGFVGWLRKDL
ncbi:MAG: hypothetical protein CMI23_01560 [Opitutae bacterium]|nr:hypothetical protein [Opitutae bacterium]|tara:strand:- start:5240 stop:6841 length:1602 start_codon:yes stop_codon:yes gene_type:complete